MIVLAHLGHWYGAFGFLVPAALVVLWIRYQARREQRRQEFSQYWTLELRHGEWRVVAMGPAPASRRQYKARMRLTPPPWADADERDHGPAYVHELVSATTRQDTGPETNGGSPPAGNGNAQSADGD
jgi:hypothetical protein